ncbi:SEN1 N terminal-domain-containing protein [Abortiporus biennis]|nr:SEN1 N terminal-domain-containing protein [Abortiporus biennis]
MSTQPSNVEEVRAKLASLRDTPAGTQDTSEAILALLYKFLIKNDTVDEKTTHWFCSKADPLIVEAATFLIRLHAYNSKRVLVWRDHLKDCLTNCPDCVRGLQEAKVSSRYTYFGAFADGVLQNFYQSFNEWECSMVLEGFASSKILPEPTHPLTETLAAVSPAIVYHALANLRILEDPRIIRIIESYSPPSTISGWPSDVPPAGLFVLMLASKQEVRHWALHQLAQYKSTPMSSEQFLPMYSEALESVVGNIMGSRAAEESRKSSSRMGNFPFADDPSILWAGFCGVLRFVPHEWFQPSAMFKPDIRHAIIGHLSDTGAHFLDVLRSFILMLQRIGPKVWAGEGSEYPLVVFNTIKDNSAYAQIEVSGRENWTVTGMQTLLKSVGDLPAFKDILPAMIQFLCEELQHERFKAVRPLAIQVASQILSAVLSQCTHESSTSQDSKAVFDAIDIHTSIIVSVAFGKAFMGQEWSEARTSTRKLVKHCLTRDIRNVAHAVSCLAKSSTTSVLPSIREQMWKNVYDTIHPSDSDSIAIVFSVLSQISHMDSLSEKAYKNVIAKIPNQQQAKKVLTTVNHALDVFRRGFEDSVSRFLDFSDSTAMLKLLRQSGVAKDVMKLMFSPVDAMREPPQAVVGLALDVESRSECFKALLSTCPDDALNGMFEFLETFTKYTQIVPEACSVSKSLALCLTDIIDAMCSSPDGLLLKDDFLKSIGDPGHSVQLPKWWNLMTRALSFIFQKTPRWADLVDIEVMILWMRDALIFGRDLLAQRKVIEAASLAFSPQSSSSNRKLSRIGKKMVDDLQPVLLELCRWLRLTDEELLHQSFALLQSLLGDFKETRIDPSEAALQKLQKHIGDARKTRPNGPQTRLDSNRLARLQDTISFWTDEDDEVEIVEHKPAPTKTGARKKEETLKGKIEPSKKPQQLTKVETSKSRVDLTQPRRAANKPSISTYFTVDDQKKLDSTVSLPKFTKSSRVPMPVAGPSKTRGGSSPAPPSEAPSTKASVVDSSSDESDDEEGGLASLAKLQKTQVVKKPVERRQVKMLDMPMNGKSSVYDRLNRRDDARRMGMRLKPDISFLHRTILSWNYDHTGNIPPGLSGHLLRVPDKFSDPNHYRRVFEPLLLMQCWAQIQQAKEETTETYECRVVSKQFTDDWIDLDLTVQEGVKKEWSLTDTDIVLLRNPERTACFLGKAQHFRVSQQGMQTTIRIISQPKQPGPLTNTIWRISKVFSLTTLHREYAALMAIPYYDMCETIMRSVLNNPSQPDSKEIQQTMKTYNLNEPQAKAILSAMTTEGFSLIQGPPGTGKTSTICGLVQMFLSRRPKPATAIHAGKVSSAADREPPKKILLCAPSNAAIDEITFRLKEGVSGAGVRDVHPKVVRVGAVKSINTSVRDVSLDHLIEQKINTDPDNNRAKETGSNEIALLRAELESVKKSRKDKLEEITNTHDNSARTLALEDEVKRLNKQRVTLTHQLDKLRDKQKSDSRTMDAVYRKFRAQTLVEADVICTTLSGSGHELLEAFDFEMVVIDEAAQAIELSSLIPLKYRCNRCVMVGDPQQLPPTVISLEASKYFYNQSLFVRLQKQRPDAVHLLSIQYRMHPDISRLPSNLFYEGRLIDGPDMLTKTQKPWHTHPKFGPYKFYNVSRGQEEPGASRSIVNRSEIQVAIALYNRLKQEFHSFDFDFKVGIVTMYRAQVIELRRAFERQFGQDILATVDFNTVDGFQGQEKDVIILSCVRAGPGLTSVGFLADVRRMNVALTRAKSSVFVLGHAATLERSDETWKKIVQDARERGCLIDTDVKFFTSASSRGPVVPQSSKPLTPVPKPPKQTITARSPDWLHLGLAKHH